MFTHGTYTTVNMRTPREYVGIVMYRVFHLMCYNITTSIERFRTCTCKFIFSEIGWKSIHPFAEKKIGFESKRRLQFYAVRPYFAYIYTTIIAFWNIDLSRRRSKLGENCYLNNSKCVVRVFAVSNRVDKKNVHLFSLPAAHRPRKTSFRTKVITPRCILLRLRHRYIVIHCMCVQQTSGPHPWK